MRYVNKKIFEHEIINRLLKRNVPSRGRKVKPISGKVIEHPMNTYESRKSKTKQSKLRQNSSVDIESHPLVSGMKQKSEKDNEKIEE